MPNTRTWYLLAGTLLVAVGVLGVAVDIHGGPFPVDTMVLGRVLAHRSAGVSTVVAAVTVVFSPLSVGIWTVLAAAVFVVHDRAPTRVVPLVATVAAAGVAGELVKLAVARPRPPVDVQVGAVEVTGSYPSGHVTGTCAFVVVLAVLATRAGGPRIVCVGAHSGAACIAVGAGVTRLYLGVHWFTDITAALALGVALALTVPAAVDHVRARRRAPSVGRPPTQKPLPHITASSGSDGSASP